MNRLGNNREAFPQPGEFDENRESLRVPHLARHYPVVGVPREGHDDIERLVRALLRLRRGRDQIFEPDLFGEPAWDILLELYASGLAGRRECVSGLSAVSGVPPTTALRWIVALEERGWIRRTPDRFDKRRSNVSLTERAEASLGAFFGQPLIAQLCRGLALIESEGRPTNRSTLRSADG